MPAADEVAELVSRGRILVSQGKVPEILQVVDALASRDAFAAVAAAVEFCLEIERPPRAQEILTPYVQRHPAEAPAWALQGELFGVAGRPGEALEAFHKATTLDPASKAFRNQWVSALAIAGRRDEVLKALREDVQQGSLSAMGHHLLAIFESDSKTRLAEVVQIGAPVRIVPMMGPANTSGVFFKSRVEDVEGAKIRVSYPTAPGVGYPWTGPGQRVLLACFKEDKYFGTETVTLRRLRDPIPMLELSQPQEMARIQRRHHLRLPIPVLKSLEWKGRAVAKFSVVNLSIGGALLSWPSPPPAVRDRAKCVLELDPKVLATVASTVTRIDAGNANGIQVAIRFDDLKPADSEKLAKRIHQYQLELRRKGLLVG